MRETSESVHCAPCYPSSGGVPCIVLQRHRTAEVSWVTSRFLAIYDCLSFVRSILDIHSRPPRGEEDTPESRERREARRVIGNPRLDARLRT